MDKALIEKEIIAIIAERLGISAASINIKSYIYEDLNASKLEFADIVQAIEEKYQLTFKVEEVKLIRTVSDIIEYIIDNAD